jgi:hypothetical protein
MKNLVLTLFATAFFVGGPATATEPVQADNPPPDKPWEEYPLDAVLTELEVDYTLWLEAQLVGDRAEKERLEKNLVGLVNYDIFVNQELVRDLAKRVALASSQKEDATGGPPSAATRSQEKVTFEQAIARLNVKEMLFRSFSRSPSFSNKYRLLGDYIDLLRKELDMPRLKLANARSGNASTDGPQTPSLNRE